MKTHFYFLLFSLEHYFGIIHYDGPIFIDQIWFNGFKTTEEYIGGALGFQPHKTFNEAFSSNATDIRFGFVDKVLLYELPRGKTNNVVSEQVRHKPACTITEAG